MLSAATGGDSCTVPHYHSDLLAVPTLILDVGFLLLHLPGETHSLLIVKSANYIMTSGFVNEF